MASAFLKKIGQGLNALMSLHDERYRAFYMMRRVTSVPRRQEIAARRAASLPRMDHPPSNEAVEKARILSRQGYVLTPGVIPSEWVADMRAYFSGQPCADPYRRLGSFVGPENVTPGTHVAFFDNKTVANAPHAFEIANLPLLLDIVASEMGAKPTISYMTAWRSIPARDGVAQHAENHHRDVDDFDFTKFFVYLTDVDEEAGPHVFIKGSHLVDKLTPIRRYQDEEVFAAFGKENEVRFTGPAGSCFLEKTYGMHRGFPPVSRPRLIFQVLYSLRPTIYGPTTPVVDRPPDGLEIDPYINRIYCRSN